MAATLDQVLASLDGVHAKLDTLAGAVATGNSKLDTLLPEMRLVMALQDDLAAATKLLQDESATLLASNDKLSQVLSDLREAVRQNQPVDPSVVAAFEDALGQHKTSVDKIATLAADQDPHPDTEPVTPPAGA